MAGVAAGDPVVALKLSPTLYSQLETTLALRDRKELDVKDAMEKTLALDKQGESEDLEEVIKTKDSEDYMRLGHLAFKANKILAICGPLLTGTAASGSAFVGHGSWAVIVAVTVKVFELKTVKQQTRFPEFNLNSSCCLLFY
ncbi:hypothetical protein NC652_010154 [Populus alba x Populus x berolinensis]|nr:hypothetical protein NC652_010154 [Populus alba x Populus x berolinensis]